MLLVVESSTCRTEAFMVFCIEIWICEIISITVHVACHFNVGCHSVKAGRTSHDVSSSIFASAIALYEPSAERLSVGNDYAVAVSQVCYWRILLHLLNILKHSTVCIIICEGIVWLECHCQSICHSLVACCHSHSNDSTVVINLIIFNALDFSIVWSSEHYRVGSLVYHLLLL